ncbi:MAG TPA: hypothetical protein VIO33_04890 [Burkholderiaceae bacterium]
MLRFKGRWLAGAVVLGTWVGGASAADDAAGIAKGLAPASAKLQYFSISPPNSGAATFNIGDRFRGPGFVTVGWAGSKKQVILPAGEWVALAAVDYANSSASAKLTTFVFGKFTGDQLAASLSVTVNRYATPVTRWTDIEACATPDATQLYQDATAMSALHVECARVHGAAGGIPANGAVADEVRASLKRLGARASGPALITQLYYAEKPHGYMRIVRADWPGLVLAGAPGQAADWQPESVATSDARKAYVYQLVRWVQGYRPIANQGFHRVFDDEDLTPGGTGAGPSHLRGIVDFEPAL